MANVLAPVARQRTFTDLGVVAPGALLYTLVSGTPNTPLATTSDAAGLVPNANPIVASAGGLFGPIYLTPGVAYHFRLTTTDGLAIWDQDPVTAGSAVTSGGGGSGAPYGIIIAGATPTDPPQTVTPGAIGTILRSAGAAAPPTWVGNGAPLVVALVDGPTVPLDASLGNVFYLSPGGDRTILVPTNPAIGQKIVIVHYGSGTARTLTLTTTAGGFRFGPDIPGLTITGAGKGDYIGCIYNPLVGVWDVVAYMKGF